ncbi:MAG TPA: hypothetical protein VG407_09210 [Caulobacteraceae bacterium]|jgi:hypothetical protein|nr:hypothetical protein [Caulobacteraceae bacterium]
MSGATKPWSAVWLVRSLGAGVVFLLIWLVALYGPRFQMAVLVQGFAAACLSACLIVAAVAFVFEVIRRVTSV